MGLAIFCYASQPGEQRPSHIYMLYYKDAKTESKEIDEIG